MADGGADPMSGVDHRLDSGVSSRHKGGSSFIWNAPLPSSADVAGLELQFPEVIQLPTAEIDRETEDWSSSGLIVRALSKWVPPEAMIREFRRAGLAGRINSISLAHRTILMKFELPEARRAAMSQPWVVNGQPLAMEAWRPDFVPADDALTSALLWIRLPNLPIEYWNDETLCGILAVAGQFVEADASTKERRRGNFARASVRVDLSKPLRPGARIRAHSTPFWQQFAYEHVDCICVNCGSLHLNGVCSSPSIPGSSAPTPKFGPWMAALRQRKISLAVEQKNQAKQSGSGGKDDSEHLGDRDGWVKPGKTSRRTAVPSPFSSNVATVHSETQKEIRPCRDLSSVPVSAVTNEANSELPVASDGSSDIPVIHNKIQMNSKGKKKISSSSKIKVKDQKLGTGFQFKAESSVIKTNVPKSDNALQRMMKGKVAANPFSLLGSDRWAGGPMDHGELNQASLKRARPVETIEPTLAHKVLNEEDRATSVVTGPSLDQGSQHLEAHEDASAVIKETSADPLSVSLSEGTPPMEQSEVVPMESAQKPDLHDLSQGQLMDQDVQEPSSGLGDHSDVDMMGAQSGA